MQQTDQLSSTKQARRARLLDVAEILFAEAGFRATTMQEIAERAVISKVTLYGYFPDKEAVFAGVAFRLGHRILTAVQRSLNEKADVTQRVTAALVAKQKIVFDLVRRSRFASELFDAKNTLVADYYRDLDAQICALIAAAISATPNDNRTDNSAKLARIVFWAADGIASSGARFNEVADDIRHMVCAVLQG
jgi:AcrR family transcriptional regulator